jgi:hypothetical protein
MDTDPVFFIICLLALFITIGLFHKELMEEYDILHSVNNEIDTSSMWDFINIETYTGPLDIRIIVPAGSRGTESDAKIYHSIIPHSRIAYVDWDVQSTHPEAHVHAQINLYVEKVVGIEDNLFPSTYKWCMINQEMTPLNLPTFRAIDVFLCKSVYAQMLINKIAASVSLKCRALLTKHTTEEISPIHSKDYNLIVHFAGKSWLKNTTKVISTWLENKGYLQFGSPVLVITCRDRCLVDSDELLRELAVNFTEHRDGSLRHITYPNIRIYKTIPEEKYKHYLSTAGFFLCPSQVEGFGHYINEGRSSGAVVITTNAPPMNELIDNTSGILVEISGDRENDGLPGSKDFVVTKEAIHDAIVAAKSLPIDNLRQLGRVARKRYEEDTRYVASTITILCQEYELKNDDNPVKVQRI